MPSLTVTYKTQPNVATPKTNNIRFMQSVTIAALKILCASGVVATINPPRKRYRALSFPGRRRFTILVGVVSIHASDIVVL